MACDCGNEEDIKRLNVAMFGNGSPENSVLIRLVNIEKVVKTVRNLGWVIVCGIVAIGIKGVASWVHFEPPSESTVAMVEPSRYGGE